VLVVSHLWPRPDFPHLGIFVVDQVKALSHWCRVAVAAPVDRTIRREEISLREFRRGLVRYRRRTRPHLLEAAGMRPLEVSYVARLPRGLFALNAARALAARLRRLDPHQFDVVHAHTVFPDGLACALWLKDTKVPLVVTAHGSDVHSMRPGMRRAMPRLLRRVNLLIPVSQALGVELCALGADPERVTVIPNGFSARLFDLQEPPPRDPRKIAYLGYLRGIKRVNLLIEALAHCPADVTLEVAGLGPDRPALEAQAAKLGLQDRVRFLGLLTRDRVPGFLAGAGIMALVSEREGWPTVIFESLACGTPVLATAVGGVPEALADSSLGRLIPRDITPSDLGREIQEALDTPWDYAAIRRHALNFSWEAISGKILQEYYRVMGLPVPGKLA